MSNKNKIVDAFHRAIVGKKIKGAVYHLDGGMHFPVILLEDDTCIYIQRDDECNGPGVPVIYSSSDDKGRTGMWELPEGEAS